MWILILFNIEHQLKKLLFSLLNEALNVMPVSSQDLVGCDTV
jgi:hypothetical protein